MSRIHELARKGDVNGVRGLLQTNAALVNEKDVVSKVVAHVHN